MKRRSAIFLPFVAVATLVIPLAGAQAQSLPTSTTFKKMCRTVKTEVGKAFLYKTQISNHINRFDPRAAGPTLICNRECPSFPATLVYSDGAVATRLGYYGVWNVTRRPRAYCAAGGVPRCSNGDIAKGARARGTNAKTRDGFVYLRMNGGVCYRVNPLVSRTGEAQ